MEDKAKNAIIKGAIFKVKNRKVLKVNVGGSTGSIFCLELGDRLHHRQERGLEFTEGAFSIMIYSSWRLDSIKEQKPITSWQEDSSLDGVMTLTLKGLLNDIVDEISVSSFFDLEIVFKSGKRLAVFCDLTSNQNMETNWFFRDGKKYYSINNFLQLVEE